MLELFFPGSTFRKRRVCEHVRNIQKKSVSLRDEDFHWKRTDCTLWGKSNFRQETFMFWLRSPLATSWGRWLWAQYWASLQRWPWRQRWGMILAFSPCKKAIYTLYIFTIVWEFTPWRCVTIPMALPTYDRLCQASGAENNVALVALCAGRNLWEKNPGRLKFDCKVRPSYDQDSLASSGFSLSFFFKSYKLQLPLCSLHLSWPCKWCKCPKVWLFAALAHFHHLPSSNRSSFLISPIKTMEPHGCFQK